VAEPGERQRLVTRAATDVEDRRGRGGQVTQQVLVEDVRADPPLHRRVRALDERIRQRGPGILRHAAMLAGSSGVVGGAALPSWLIVVAATSGS
jgi:hypothetical protein